MMTHHVDNTGFTRTEPRFTMETNAPWKTAQGSAEDPHERVLMELAHAILDFNFRVQAIIQPCASLENPESLERFAKGVSKNSSALLAARDGALGSFSTFAAFIKLLFCTDPNLRVSNQNSSPTTERKGTFEGTLRRVEAKPVLQKVSEARTISTALSGTNSTFPGKLVKDKANLQNPKEKYNLQATTIQKFPCSTATSNESNRQRSKKQLTLSDITAIVKTATPCHSRTHRGAKTCNTSENGREQSHRRPVRAYGQEEKGFALITTDPSLPAIRSPNFLGSLFAGGGLKDPLTVFETSKPHQFLVFGPLDCLPKLEGAYECSRRRLARKRGFLNLPGLSVKPLNDVMEICADNATKTDLLQLVKSLRREIERLEAQHLRWGPRQFFSEALRLHEKKCYETLRRSYSSFVLEPLSVPLSIPLA